MAAPARETAGVRWLALMSLVATAMMFTSVMIHAIDARVVYVRAPVTEPRPERHSSPMAYPPVAAPSAPAFPSPIRTAPAFAPPTSPPSIAVDDSLPPSLLQVVAPGEHRPARLLALSQRLTREGVDVTSISTALGDATTRLAVGANGLSQLQVVPMFARGRAAGLRFVNVYPGSLAARAGLRSGDVLLTVNGFTVPTTDHDPLPVSLASNGVAVLEVVREGHRLVLAVTWTPTSPTPQPALARATRRAISHT